MKGETLLTFRASPYLRHTKTHRWFIVAGVIVLSLIVYAILQHDFVFAVLLLTLAGVYFLVHRNEERLEDCALTTLGLVFKDNLFAYTDIESFYIIHEPNMWMSLNINISDSKLNPLTLHLHNADIESVRTLFLHKNIEEIEGKKESLTLSLARFLKI